MKPQELYSSLQKNFRDSGDRGFCVPLAISALTGLDWKKVQKVFLEVGRPKGKGTTLIQVKAALAKLGYELEQVDEFSIIRTYPGVHRNLKSITSKHTTRFKESFKGKKLMMWGRSHTWAVIDGETEDWSHTRSLRANLVFEIVKKGKKPKEAVASPVIRICRPIEP